MGKRIVDIVESFKIGRGSVELKLLSEELKVNERTLRYDIDEINEELRSMNIPEILKVGKGLFKGDIKTLEDYLDKSVRVSDGLIKDYKKEIILILIAFKGEVNISVLCDDLDLGRTTIKSTIKEIKEVLDLYRLELLIEAQKGLRLTGEEEDIRKLQLKLINQYGIGDKISSFEKKYLGNHIKKYFETIDNRGVIKFIEYVLDSLKRVISDEAYEIISNYILIMILRIRKGRGIKSSKNENFFYETSEYSAIKKSSVLLEAEYGIRLEAYEILGLTDYFMGSHLYSSETSSMKNWIEVEVLTKNLIDEFSKISRLDLSSDKALLEGLINHIKPTIYRIKNNIELENLITEEFKEHYPRILKDTIKSTWILKEFIGKEVPLDETAFIGMYFKSAIDRNKNKINKSMDILIVCGMGYGTSRFISQQIRERYQVNIIDIIPENRLKKYIDGKTIDVIVSTSMRVNEYHKIPVIKVDPILDTKDFTLLEENNFSRYSNKIPLSIIVEEVEKNTKIENYKGLLEGIKKFCSKFVIDDIKSKHLTLVELLGDKTIKVEEERHSWKEALRIAGKVLEDNGIIKSSYTENMIDSVIKNGSYMITEDGLALPHSKNNGDVSKTGMALVVFKEEVVFPEDKKVRAILAFSSIDGREHLDPLTEFVNLVKKHDFMEFLANSASKRKIVEKIKKYDFLVKLGSKN